MGLFRYNDRETMAVRSSTTTPHCHTVFDNADEMGKYSSFQCFLRLLCRERDRVSICFECQQKVLASLKQAEIASEAKCEYIAHLLYTASMPKSLTGVH